MPKSVNPLAVKFTSLFWQGLLAGSPANELIVGHVPQFPGPLSEKLLIEVQPPTPETVTE